MRNPPAFILAVEDDPAGGRLLQVVLERGGYEVEVVTNGPDALARVRERPPAAVALDVHLPGMDGRQVLRELQRDHRTVPVVMVTANNDVATAVECIQLGAFDYLSKPLEPDALLLRIRHAVERSQLIHEVSALRRLAGDDAGLAEAMGGSARICDLVDAVQRVADTHLTVLLHGETGTGKDLVAVALHHLSTRRGKPFVTLDCAALSETALESELFGYEQGAFAGAHHRHEGLLHRAAGGTVLLDEIGSLAPRLQARLLRMLEERQVTPIGAAKPLRIDVRFVASSNEDLERAVATGAFRRDLYFRVAEYTVRLPPLRSRPEDIPHLVRRILSEWPGPLRTMSPNALAVLRRGQWPGNVRQLRNVVRQAALAAEGTVIEAHHLRVHEDRTEAPGHDGRPLKDIAETASADAEKAAIRGALLAAGGNRAAAARALRVDYKTLYVKLKRYEME
ncbi:MAG: sigma-54 dependent transcriptional regulator [Myxococcota bacterium]